MSVQWKQRWYPSFLIVNLKNLYVLVSDSASRLHATDNCRYSEWVGRRVRLELNFTFPVKLLIEFMYWQNDCLWLQFTSLVMLERTSKTDTVDFQQMIYRISRLKYRYVSSFPFELRSKSSKKDFCPKKHNSSKCRVRIGYWLKNFVTICNWQFLSVAKCTVSSFNNTS